MGNAGNDADQEGRRLLSPVVPLLSVGVRGSGAYREGCRLMPRRGCGSDRCGCRLPCAVELKVRFDGIAAVAALYAMPHDNRRVGSGAMDTLHRLTVYHGGEIDAGIGGALYHHPFVCGIAAACC